MRKGLWEYWNHENDIYYKFEEFKIFLPGKAKTNHNYPVIWKNSSD